MIFACALTIRNFRSLNDVVSVNVRMTFDWFQSQAMWLPCNKIV